MKNFVFLESIKKMPLMKLPVRSTYIPLESGKILLSPGSCLTDAQLKSLGKVTDIVAPNLFHCGGIPQAATVYSTAKIWGVQGAKAVKKEISWTAELTTNTWPYQDELPMIEIAGMPKVNEKVFFHKKSKSLFIADLCFNLVDSKGIGPWLILNMFGTYKIRSQ